MQQQGLYQPRNEHDACGLGFVAHIKGKKSHEIVRDALKILENLDHRGAVGADPLMGDGAGILMQLPDALFRESMGKQGIVLPQEGDYGVGMIFLPKEPASRQACEQELERAVKAEGCVVLGWRDVPVDSTMEMSPVVRAKAPVIRQIFVGRGPDEMVTEALERKLYLIRKTASHAIQALKLQHGSEYYVPSMSARTIVYKGLLLAHQVPVFYKDLSDPRCVSALAMVHQRFSTNTFPEWPLAHPYRMLVHNGEINTVKGNFNWLRAREGVMKSPVLGDSLKRLFPIVYDGQSDTATFDNCLELLVMAGYPLAQAVMMMIPEAWDENPLMDENRRAFYEYHAAMMEPWDGPAAMAFTDGRQIGAVLDRNGLRPSRYLVTDDDRVILASEAGVLPIPEEHIVKKWRLLPGKMLLIDTVQGRIIDDKELKDSFANAKPYREWVNRIQLDLDGIGPSVSNNAALLATPLLSQQKAFGFTKEDIKFILEPMAKSGQEATGSMGNDTPLAVLSARPKPLSRYFRQLFAQVTNPPIDPIREQLVMSLISFIGPKPNLLDLNNVNPPMRIKVNQPVLDFASMEKLRHIDELTTNKFKSYELDICYPVEWGKDGIEARLASLCAEAEDAVRSGYNILIVSDRKVDAGHVAVPALLATSAIHLRLVKKGLRTSTGLVVETGTAREVQDFALLAGYGAEAVHPYLAMQTLLAIAQSMPDMTPELAIEHYVKAIGKGLRKVMSKMGISTYMSYCGAQIFEAVGLSKSLVDKFFTGTSSQVEGMTIFDIAEETLRMHRAAFGDNPWSVPKLDNGGEYAYRADGEEHMWTPDAIAKLQHATRADSFKTYQEYAQIINDQSKRHMTLRGLLEFKTDGVAPIPLEEVEPAKEIVKRFVTGAMSMGSISTEAHTTMALAMNRIGGKSNTGEGGEDEARYENELRGIKIHKGQKLTDILGTSRVVRDLTLEEGDSLRSRIKQVASGRFGVTAEYLISADQIQIKMAQGAKPGEGGQLPGKKVSEYIGKMRYSVPGVILISPPPHHDIYSIEDLAQLIHDLKSVNPAASISVKLVSEVGVGTVAAGVAKCKADHVTISGHDGGTGASPQSSIKHAGSPWELGLAETQQTLILNGLRGRIIVQVDGQMKTGRDVAIGAMLGAEEFGFATAPLVTEGCIMMRKCHLNTCPVGVATQDPELRKKFSGKPEYIVRYFFFVAEEVREIMASLGIRKFDDLIGRVDLLKQREGVTLDKTDQLDFTKILFHAQNRRHDLPHSDAQYCVESQDHGLEKALDHQLIAKAKPALEKKKRVAFGAKICNVDRSVGGMLSGEIAKRYLSEGLPDDTIHVEFTGTAGQSFAEFLEKGVTFDLVGQANDYVGKGLSGGCVIVRAPAEFRGKRNEEIIAGNTILYGATSGSAYFNGVVGERFMVRNSGATAVVEGVGDHGCEYMTGGTAVVLGQTGRNFAAGMSGGIAYVYDPCHRFVPRCNMSMVDLEPVKPEAEQDKRFFHSEVRGGKPEADEVILKRLVSNHAKLTGSVVAQSILADWDNARADFVKVFPKEYRAVFEKAAAKETAKA